MIEKYDIIESVKDLNDQVRKGCTGTVLMIYRDFPMAYEVEFMNDRFETLDVLTVLENEIVKVDS